MLIFYSPKISTGVDITILTEKTTQFVYIKGKSVDSIQLFQMATRTRNMSEMNYYSCAGSTLSEYEDVEDCMNKNTDLFNKNKLGRSHLDYDKESIIEFNEKMYFSMYCYNEYYKDYFNTNVTHFFEEELRGAGFVMVDNEDDVGKLDEETKTKMNERREEINDDKFEYLLTLLNEDEGLVSDTVSDMLNRVKILKLDSEELVNEYRDVVEDEYKFEHFLNYNRLNKSYDYCQNKLVNIVNSKMLTGLEKNVWTKIMYIHMLAVKCGIHNDLFNIANIQMPEMNEEVIKLISTIKALYNKRDKVNAFKYDLSDMIKLYKFMVDHLTGLLGLIKGKKSNARGAKRDKLIYNVDKEAKERYDKLISLMNVHDNVDVTIEFECDMA